MEIKLYLRKLLGKWWLILIAFLLTVIPTVLLVREQPWIYEAKTSFVIRPRSSLTADQEEFVKAVDTLSRRTEINTTFSEVASSRLIKQRAIDQLDLTSGERKGLKVNARVIAGTNVLEIIVQGLQPGVVRDFANAISLETTDYIRNLYDVFELEPLDTATLPDSPVRPNKPLTIALGGIFGLILGVGLVFFIEYLNEPLPEDGSFNITDKETGVYNEPYFRLRLGQELSRAGHRNHSFSLALIKLNRRNLASGKTDPIPAAKASPQLTSALASNMRKEDILAHLGDSVFALLLPDMSGEVVSNLMDAFERKIESLTPSDVGSDNGVVIYSSVGIVTYVRGETTGDELLEQAAKALDGADADAHDKATPFSRSNTRHTLLANGEKSNQHEYLLKQITGR